jgi:hypothetical protein
MLYRTRFWNQLRENHQVLYNARSTKHKVSAVQYRQHWQTLQVASDLRALFAISHSCHACNVTRTPSSVGQTGSVLLFVLHYKACVTVTDSWHPIAAPWAPVFDPRLLSFFQKNSFSLLCTPRKHIVLEVQLHLYFHFVSRLRRVVFVTPWPLYLRGKGLRCLLNTSLCRPQGRFWTFRGRLALVESRTPLPRNMRRSSRRYRPFGCKEKYTK